MPPEGPRFSQYQLRQHGSTPYFGRQEESLRVFRSGHNESSSSGEESSLHGHGSKTYHRQTGASSQNHRSRDYGSMPRQPVISVLRLSRTTTNASNFENWTQGPHRLPAAPNSDPSIPALLCSSYSTHLSGTETWHPPGWTSYQRQASLPTLVVCLSLPYNSAFVLPIPRGQDPIALTQGISRTGSHNILVSHDIQSKLA